MNRSRLLGYWLAVVLLSLSWYPLTGIYEAPNIHHRPSLWFAAVALGISLLLIFNSQMKAREQEDRSRSAFRLIAYGGFGRRALRVLFASALAFSILIPFPYNIPGFLILASAVLSLSSARFPGRYFTDVLSSSSNSLFFCGTVLAFQAAVLPFFYLFASRYHRIEFLGPVLASFLQLFGAHSSFSDGYLLIQSADRVFSLIPSFDALGLYPSLNILAGGFLLLFLFKSPRRYYVLLPLALLAYMLLRYAGMILLFLQFEEISIFWNLPLMAFSLLPLPFLFAKLLHSVSGKPQPERAGSNARPSVRRGVILAASTVVFVMSCVLFFGFADPGSPKGGRILIDEAHSDWEWTTERFDTTWYGEKSTYNYYSMAQYLKYYYRVDQKRKLLTDSLLRNYDVLFIKTPTKSFGKNETLAIRRFVQNGGGLLLVGDHTNVFGISTNLNPLAEQFGMKFNYNAQYDLDGELSDYEKPKILAHPIVQWMPKFMFATGCTIDAPLTAETPIIGYGIKAIDADYSQKNFFPKNAAGAENVRFGLFVQAAGIPFGNGRVFLLSDSTPWSNFFMFIPGKPELLLGIMEWLNRSNTVLSGLKMVSAVLGLLSLICCVAVTMKMNRETAMIVSLSAAFFTAPLSIFAVEKVSQIRYPVPHPHTGYVRVNFESEHSSFELPVLHITMRAEESYHTFFITLQRLDYVPSLKTSYADALNNGDAVVVVNPLKPFEEKEIAATKEFLKSGGRLLVIDDPRYTHHTVVDKMLSEFGITLLARDTIGIPASFTMTLNQPDENQILTRAAGEVKGGLPFIFARRRGEQGDFPTPFRSRAQILQNDGFHGAAEFDNSPGHEGRFPPHVFPTNSGRQVYAEQVTDTSKVFPVGAVVHYGKGTLVVIAASSLFTDREMGFSTAYPAANMRKIYDLEYRIFQNELGLTGAMVGEPIIR